MSKCDIREVTMILVVITTINNNNNNNNNNNLKTFVNKECVGGSLTIHTSWGFILKLDNKPLVNS